MISDFGRRTTAPCGHVGEHVIGNYVRCLSGCDRVAKSDPERDPWQLMYSCDRDTFLRLFGVPGLHREVFPPNLTYGAGQSFVAICLCCTARARVNVLRKAFDVAEYRVSEID